MSTIMEKDGSISAPTNDQMDALGGRTMTTEEFSQGSPQFDATRAVAQDYAAQADSVMAESLEMVKNSGSIQQYRAQAEKSLATVSDKIAKGSSQDQEEFDPPTFPGNVYLNHLFKRTQKAQEGQPPAKDDALDIYTEQAEALKLAIGAMGIYSDRNPSGMPIDSKAARKLWFGTDQVDPIKESEWRSMVETGDRGIDPKSVRKFANYDGSLTWEMLNEDKTVMSRFTLGENKGKKIFVQGGYSKFAEALKKLEQGSTTAGFDSMQKSMGGA